MRWRGVSRYTRSWRVSITPACIGGPAWTLEPVGAGADTDRGWRFATIEGVDPHAVLGLDPGASPEEVHRAYRALAKRFHPDHAGEQAGELMISINAAYDLLRDQLAEAV